MLFQRIVFKIRIVFKEKCLGFVRKKIYSLQGMHIGMGTNLPSIKVTWPHQLSIGAKCVLEHGIHFKFDGIWSQGPSIVIEDEVFIGFGCEFNSNCGILISKYANIASGCKFIDHDHGTVAGLLIGPQPSIKEKIIIGKDAWLGCNVVVLKGVTISEGAVVAAGAVVTKSIPANQIWGGVPAKYIKTRSE